MLSMDYKAFLPGPLMPIKSFHIQSDSDRIEKRCRTELASLKFDQVICRTNVKKSTKDSGRARKIDVNSNFRQRE
jgi:hypothetical protein